MKSCCLYVMIVSSLAGAIIAGCFLVATLLVGGY